MQVLSWAAALRRAALFRARGGADAESPEGRGTNALQRPLRGAASAHLCVCTAAYGPSSDPCRPLSRRHVGPGVVMSRQ